MGLRAALVRQEDGLVVNIIMVNPSFDPQFAWTPPEGHIVVLAMRQDGSYRYVGPGFRYDASNDRFLFPHISGPGAARAGQSIMLTVTWHDEDNNPVAYQAPVTIEVMGQRATYAPDAQGRVRIPLVSHAPGTYTVMAVEPELGVVLSQHVVVVS